MSPFRFAVPAAQTAQSFSFLGVIFPDKVFNSTVITLTDLRNGPVAVDDVILGAAPPLPEPTPWVMLSLAALLRVLWLATRSPNSTRLTR